jgi:hypothetical protein
MYLVCIKRKKAGKYPKFLSVQQVLRKNKTIKNHFQSKNYATILCLDIGTCQPIGNPNIVRVEYSHGLGIDA